MTEPRHPKSPRILNPTGRDLAMTIAAHIKALAWVSSPHYRLDDILVTCTEKPITHVTRPGGIRGAFYDLIVATPKQSWRALVSATGFRVILDGLIVLNLQELTTHVKNSLTDCAGTAVIPQSPADDGSESVGHHRGPGALGRPHSR